MPTAPKQTSTPTVDPEDEVIELTIRPRPILQLPERLLRAEVRDGTHQGDTPERVEHEEADVALPSNEAYAKSLQEVTEEMARTILSSGWMNEVVERVIATAGDGVSRRDVKDTVEEVMKTAMRSIELSQRQVLESILNATQKVSELI
jgi:hypothetical protein